MEKMKALHELKFQGLIKSHSGTMTDATRFGAPPEEFHADTGSMVLDKMLKRAREIREGKPGA